MKQLKKENPNLKENPVRFDVGPKDSKSPFEGYIIWFFEDDLKEGNIPKVDWNFEKPKISYV